MNDTIRKILYTMLVIQILKLRLVFCNILEQQVDAKLINVCPFHKVNIVYRKVQAVHRS